MSEDSNKAYVLMEIGWEYNDETYYQSSSGGGSPRKSFDSFEAATLECTKKNVEELKELFLNGELHDYAYDPDEIVDNPDELDAILKKLCGCTMEEWWENYYKTDYSERKGPFTTEPTFQQWSEIYDCFSLQFWEIVEVEKG